MIFLMGDSHGSFQRFVFLKDKILNKHDIVIHVGDFGFYDKCLGEWKMLFPNGFPCKVYAISGNHEDYRLIRMWEAKHGTDKPIEVLPNLFYVPRGHVEMIDGILIGFLGGAGSVDKTWRTPEVSWFKDEDITRSDIENLYKNVGSNKLDLLVTHAPPVSTISTNFPPLNKKGWGLPENWEDISANYVEEVYNHLNPTRLVCGHMHKSVLDRNIRILNIDEVIDFPRM